VKRPARVTFRKYQGDDSHSWAVFVDGRPRLTGLAKSEVAYYVRIERERIGAK
jgi:hypothetical protein